MIFFRVFPHLNETVVNFTVRAIRTLKYRVEFIDYRLTYFRAVDKRERETFLIKQNVFKMN